MTARLVAMRPTPHPGAMRSLALLAVLTCAPAAAAQGRFAAEITAWVEQDQLHPPPDDAVLFAGSSSIRRWETLAAEFAHYDVIQRGFGGSQFEDLNGYVEQIVLPYEPAAIVVFEGTNDIAAGKTPATVFADYLTFVDLVRRGTPAGRPPVPILYIGITPTPARWSMWSAAQQVNASIESHAAATAGLHYIDTPTAFLATGGPPSAALFVADGLHLSPPGYALWTSVIRPVVEAVVPTTKAYVPNPQHPPVGSELLIDLGPSDTVNGNPTPSPSPGGDHWNNWHVAVGGAGVLAGQSLGNLVATDGRATGIDLVITGGFSSNGIRNGGLLAPSPQWLGPLAVPTATQDYFFGDGLDLPGGFVLTGLDPGAAYDLRLFGSRNTAETRISTYRGQGGCPPVTAMLQTSGVGVGRTAGYQGNEDRVAELLAMPPDRFGQLFVDLSRAAGSFAYLNVLEVRVVAAPVTMLGGGCGAAMAAPRLTSCALRAGTTVAASASGLVPGVAAGLYASAGPVPALPLGPCTLHLAVLQPANLWLVARGVTDATGAWPASIPLPAAPGVVGLRLSLQAFSLGRAGTRGFELTNGVLGAIAP
ncbi:MAG: GDSL-type esterase/lipase family protein [Planctomycetota bacterium]